MVNGRSWPRAAGAGPSDAAPPVIGGGAAPCTPLCSAADDCPALHEGCCVQHEEQWH